MPKSYAEARTDGERWRWMLVQTAELQASRVNEVDVLFADFLRQQFGVQTMASRGWAIRDEDDRRKDESGPYALRTD